MPHSRRKRPLAWNGIWTIAMSGATALPALVLPPFLARELPPDAYGAWALALQIASYVLLLGFGLQVAVGRFVAIEQGAPDHERRPGIVAAAFHLSVGAAAIGVVLIAAAASGMPRFLTDMPPLLRTDFQWALIICGASAAIGLVGTVFTGTFLGEQRAHVPASVSLVGRVVQCVLVVVTAMWKPSLTALAAAFCAGQLLLVAGQVVVWRAWSGVRYSLRRVADGGLYRELCLFCAPFVLWNLLAAISFGTDLVIVSRVDFDQTPYYAVSLTAITLLVGLLAAGYNAMLPAAAERYGAGDMRSLQELLLRGGRIGIAISLAVGVPLIVAGGTPLGWWVGEDYGLAAAPYLALLAAAQIVRMTMSMYGVVTIAAGRHRTMLIGPVLDAAVALTVAIGLGLRMGATGVAVGMVAGAATSMLAWCVRDPLAEVFDRREVAWSFLRRTMLAPLSCAAGGVALIVSADRWLGWLDDDWSRLAASLLVAAAVAATAVRRPSGSVPRPLEVVAPADRSSTPHG